MAIPDLANEVLPTIGRVLPALAGVAALGGTAFKSVVDVPDKHVGLRVSRQRPRRKYDSIFPGNPGVAGGLIGTVGPGKRLVWPFLGDIKLISTQDNISDLQTCTVDTKNERQHTVQYKVTWGVIPEKDEAGNSIDYGLNYDELIYNALYKTPDFKALENRVLAICGTGVRQSLLEMPELRDVQAERLHEDLVGFCGASLLEYGTELRGFDLGESPFTPADIMAQAIAKSGQLPVSVLGMETKQQF